MTLRILTCSSTSFIVEGTKYLLRMSLKSLQSMRMQHNKNTNKNTSEVQNLCFIVIWEEKLNYIPVILNTVLGTKTVNRDLYGLRWFCIVLLHFWSISHREAFVRDLCSAVILILLCILTGYIVCVAVRCNSITLVLSCLLQPDAMALNYLYCVHCNWMQWHYTDQLCCVLQPDTTPFSELENLTLDREVCCHSDNVILRLFYRWVHSSQRMQTAHIANIAAWCWLVWHMGESWLNGWMNQYGTCGFGGLGKIHIVLGGHQFFSIQRCGFCTTFITTLDFV